MRRISHLRRVDTGLRTNLGGRVRYRVIPRPISVVSCRGLVKYALLSYRNTENLGDEIQSIAARQFLPRVDLLVDRDFLTEVAPESEERFGLVLNGWFKHRPENWPPPKHFIPLPVSMRIGESTHIAGRLRISPQAVMLDERLAAYLRHWGPVGARDLRTLEQLEAAGVPAYLSGCLTLTLRRDPVVERRDEVVLVDVPSKVAELVRASTRRDVVIVTHGEPGMTDPAQRFRRAEHLLLRYQSAHCVITSRLHAALPCLAYDTPVLLVRSQTDTRFDGLNQLVRTGWESELLGGRVQFNIEDPPPNDLDYLRLREALVERVTRFVDELESGIGQSIEPYVVAPREREDTLRGLLADANHERDRLRVEVTTLDSEIVALRDSRSWRFTKPARRLGALVRRLRRP